MTTCVHTAPVIVPSCSCRESEQVPPVYTRSEVRQHCHVASCWIIVDDEVYDVTKFLLQVSGDYRACLHHVAWWVNYFHLTTGLSWLLVSPCHYFLLATTYFLSDAFFLFRLLLNGKNFWNLSEHKKDIRNPKQNASAKSYVLFFF